jgi:hypothetical protein
VRKKDWGTLNWQPGIPQSNNKSRAMGIFANLFASEQALFNGIQILPIHFFPFPKSKEGISVLNLAGTKLNCKDQD